MMRVEMLILQKIDFDWLLTFYPPPMECLRDELTDWAQVLQWISLPKVYAKKIRRIVQLAASAEGGATGGDGLRRSYVSAGGSASIASDANSISSPIVEVAAAAKAAASVVLEAGFVSGGKQSSREGGREGGRGRTG